MIVIEMVKPCSTMFQEVKDTKYPVDTQGFILQSLSLSHVV